MYFYGSTPETLALLRDRVMASFPSLRLSGMESPPFRALTPDEDAAAVTRINQSGAGVVFVGLGCPKQEFWMAEHRGRIEAVMLGVGAAVGVFARGRAVRYLQNFSLNAAFVVFTGLAHTRPAAVC